MAHVIAHFRALSRVGLLKVMDLHSAETPQQWKRIIGGNIITTKQEFERIDQISDFGLAAVVSEATPIAFDTLLPGFTKDYYPLMRAIGFSVSKQANYTDLYNKVKRPGPKMAEALDSTLNFVVANLLNNGFSSSYTGPDTKSLFATDHPLASGSASNRASTATTLEASSLATARTAMRQQKSHRGKPMPSVGETLLIVPPALEFSAKTILRSVLLPGTSDNDANVVKETMSLEVNDYLSSSTAWFLRNQKQHSLFLLKRIPRFVEDDYKMEKQMLLYATGEEYVAGWFDWRGTYGNQGA